MGLCIWVKGRNSGNLFLAIGANEDDDTLILHDGSTVASATVTQPATINATWQELVNDIPAMIAFCGADRLRLEIRHEKSRHAIFINGEKQGGVAVFQENPVLFALMAVQSEMNRQRFMGSSDGENAVNAMNLVDEAVIKGFSLTIRLTTVNGGVEYTLDIGKKMDVYRHQNPIIALIGGMTDPNKFS